VTPYSLGGIALAAVCLAVYLTLSIRRRQVLFARILRILGRTGE
jgi:hypothetical protein